MFIEYGFDMEAGDYYCWELLRCSLLEKTLVQDYSSAKKT